MDILKQLSQTSVFSSIPPKRIQQIKDMAASRSFHKGTYVTFMGDVWPYLLFVKSGEFQALKESSGGRSFALENFGPGEIFWGLALFEAGKPNPATIRAAKDSELLLWHVDHIEAIIGANTQVAWGLFRLLAEKMERVSEIVEELVFQPLTGRLANLLVTQFDGAVDNVIARDLTLDEMAARIGSTREMVCKILYKFADNGIIDIHRTEFKINDHEKLGEIANTMKGL